MNERKSFYRKVAYGLAIAVLLFPLSLLSSPATVDSPGGKLAQLRTEYRLSQADLGEIDPASETIKLATLGLRGVAVNLLWNQANHFKKVEDWTSLTATLEQLAKLQPNFITFWKYQSWNLSYNVSVEFDDYHDRYYWVRRGIQFLQQGVRYNRDNPDLLWELGWVNGQKVGRADEKIQYRRLYKSDDELHPTDRTPEQRDNWLVSKMHYLESIATVDEKGKSLGKKSPAIYYSSAPKSQMNYAEAIEEEGLFDKAVAAWKRASDEWRDYGNIVIEHSTGVPLRFNDLDDLAIQISEKEEELKSLLEGVEEKAIAAAREALSKEQLEAYEMPPAERSDDQVDMAYEVKRALKMTPDKLAAIVMKESPENQREAATISSELSNLNLKKRFTESYRETTNYDYWKLRCEFEQFPSAVKARELMYRANLAFEDNADPIQAKELYEEGFERWSEVFAEFPDLKDTDGTTGDDVMVFIYDYVKVLEQLDERIADDFPLWFLIDDFDSEDVFRLIRAKREQERLDAEAASSSNAASEAQTEAAPKSEDASETASEPEGEPEAEIESETEVEPESKNQSETQPEIESESGANTSLSEANSEGE